MCNPKFSSSWLQENKIHGYFQHEYSLDKDIFDVNPDLLSFILKHKNTLKIIAISGGEPLIADANLFLNELGMANAAGVMTLGQISEALFILLLPIFLNKYGIKKTLIIGMLPWSLRYVLFAFGDTGSNIWMLIFGIVLHGICYDFFFVSGQIYTDYKAGEKYKSAAQGLIALATYGIGMLIGFRLAGIITDQYAIESGHDWTQIWTFPAIFAAVVLVIFIVTFKNEKIEVEK